MESLEIQNSSLMRFRKKLRIYYGVTAITGFVAGLFFISFDITGNVIQNPTNPITNGIGMGFIVIGIISLFFWRKLNNS